MEEVIQAIKDLINEKYDEVGQDRLKILADWLKDKDFYSIRDGVIEDMIKSAKQDVCETIADYIDEIMEMDDEQIKNELKRDNGEKG